MTVTELIKLLEKYAPNLVVDFEYEDDEGFTHWLEPTGDLEGDSRNLTLRVT